jgi:hypothetical protein
MHGLALRIGTDMPGARRIDPRRVERIRALR